MKILLRIVAVLFVAIALFLVYAVINAPSSDGGARVGAAVAYVAGAIILSFLALTLGRRTSRPAGVEASSGGPA